jgi:putative transposase
MTREDFVVLQSDLQKSGMSITKYLQHVGINYNTYNYWRKKVQDKDSKDPSLVPISFTRPSDPASTSGVPSGATLLFPNGLRAHFGTGMEDVLRELLDKSLVSHVLP